MVQVLPMYPCRLNTGWLWSMRHTAVSGQTRPEASEPVTEPIISVSTGQMGTEEQRTAGSKRTHAFANTLYLLGINILKYVCKAFVMTDTW